MDDQDPIAALLEYDHWCTERVALKMDALPPHDLRREFPIGWHTLRKTLHHIVLVAEYWTDRSRADPTGMEYAAHDPGPDALSVADLRERYRTTARQMFANLEALNATPPASRDAAWLIRRNHLIHITTHGMHHRAQVIFMLTQLGVADVIEGGDFGGWANEPIIAAGGGRAVLGRYI